MGGVAQNKGQVVRLLVPLALPTLLDYLWPEGVPAPKPGDWADVQVGRNAVSGVVAEVLTSSPFQNLKVAAPRPDVPALKPSILAFYRFAARYNLAAPGEALRISLPKGSIPPHPMVGRGNKRQEKEWEKHDYTFTPVTLNPEQRTATQAITRAHGFAPFVLDGITGSGKTEVYFAAAHHLLGQLSGEPNQILILVPEISLTPQWLKRFEQRFGTKPAVWHSGLTPLARQTTWWGVALGHAQVVVGARSALFLPWNNLRLVVVDEEHDPSYKQDDGFKYHGRNMAVALASHVKCPVVLASATPSLESFANAQSGKYQLLHLPSRHGGAALPTVHILDIKADKPKPGDYLTRPLREAIQQTLDRKEQVLLYLNRRGVAPVLICGTCGHRRDCPRCDATLVVHGERLTCHHCGYTEVRPDECPACNAPDLRPYGPGTQRIGAEVQKIFPDARVAVADSDVVGTTAAMADLIKRILAREIDIIVGTQMVTKGHHFPYLTTVGVVDADMGLAHGDLRAAERTFQLLTQVAGRAGREELPGHVYIQSHDPSHALFDALKKHDRDGFYAVELAARQAWHDPPYGRQVAIRLAGKNQGIVRQAAQTLAESFPKETDHTLLGPAPAVTERVNDTYRWRLLIKAPGISHQLIKDWLETTPIATSVQLQVDVDPL